MGHTLLFFHTIRNFFNIIWNVKKAQKDDLRILVIFKTFPVLFLLYHHHHNFHFLNPSTQLLRCRLAHQSLQLVPFHILVAKMGNWTIWRRLFWKTFHLQNRPMICKENESATKLAPQTTNGRQTRPSKLILCTQCKNRAENFIYNKKYTTKPSYENNI